MFRTEYVGKLGFYGVFFSKNLKARRTKRDIRGWVDAANLREYWFHIALMICVAIPIILLYFLDLYHLQGFNWRFDPAGNVFLPWKNTFLTQNFSFDVTWKGRMFYLFFGWFLVIESLLNWKVLTKKIPANRKLMAASFACAIIPTIYVLVTNFFGLDLAVLKLGQRIGIPAYTASGQPSDFLNLQWPISLEYLVFFIFFIVAFMLAYRPRGMKIFSISFVLLGAVGFAYMLDTVYQFGLFRPLQEIALPVSATTAALFDLLGYKVDFNYPVQVGGSSIPGLTVSSGGHVASVSISWACAGVYSLVLYLLIILVFFKRADISGFRKVLYFFIGLFGTFVSAVLRIYSIVIIEMHQGITAGMAFHNTYGELFGFTWIFLFILLIVCIEKFMLVERIRAGMKRIGSHYNSSDRDKTVSSPI